MKFKIFAIYFLLCLQFCNSQDSEFIIPKKIQQVKNLNDSQKILPLINRILEFDILLNEFSIDLRKFMFKQAENCIQDEDLLEDKKLYLELELLKEELDKSLKNFKKKLFSLKKKFKN